MALLRAILIDLLLFCGFQSIIESTNNIVDSDIETYKVSRREVSDGPHSTIRHLFLKQSEVEPADNVPGTESMRDGDVELEFGEEKEVLILKNKDLVIGHPRLPGKQLDQCTGWNSKNVASVHSIKSASPGKGVAVSGGLNLQSMDLSSLLQAASSFTIKGGNIQITNLRFDSGGNVINNLLQQIGGGGTDGTLESAETVPVSQIMGGVNIELVGTDAFDWSPLVKKKDKP